MRLPRESVYDCQDAVVTLRYRKFDDKYQLSLFCADMLQAIGAFMDVRWVHEGSVNVGSYCRAQGQSKYLLRSEYKRWKMIGNFAVPL